MSRIERKLGLSKQLRGVYEIAFTANRECGKRGLLIYNNKLEVFLNVSNALDIGWVRYRGSNLSFLSRNGFNHTVQPFEKAFEGGFLYTCGLDNVSSCVENAPVHGSFHHLPAENVSYRCEGDRVVLEGEICSTALFGDELVLKRTVEIGETEIRIRDSIENRSYKPTEYVFLYHINFGYPMLDDGTEIHADFLSAEGLTSKAEQNKTQMLFVTEPTDGETEDVYYCEMKRGNAEVVNKTLGLKVELTYDRTALPEFLIWKSMKSGDYALGLEPSLTRFRPFRMKKIGKDETHAYEIAINVSEIS